MGLKDKRDLVKLQAYLDRQPLIKFENIDNSFTINSLLDILKIAIDYNYDNTTVFLNDTIQCRAFKYRTIDDIYLLCKYYRINISLKNIEELLNELELARIIMRFDCDDVKKITNTSANTLSFSKQLEDYFIKHNLNIKNGTI